MKLLLTSSGISNPSIHNALVDLLGKPVAESNALFVPTGIYPFSGGTAMAFALIPHANHEDRADASFDNTPKWAAKLPVPLYAIDDQTAIKVIGDAVEVVCGIDFTVP